MAAAPRNVRRLRLDPALDPTLDIDRFQLLHYVLRAAFVTRARAFARSVEIGAEPALEVDGLQHAVAAREIDLPVAEVENVLEELVADLLSILIVEEDQAVFVLVDALDLVDAGQVKMR